MKKHIKTLKKTPKRLYASLFAVLFAAVSVSIISLTHAGTGGSLTATPSAASVAVGSKVTVTITAANPTEAVNAIQADLTYDKTKLQFDSIDATPITNPRFDVVAQSDGATTPGTVYIARGSSLGVKTSSAVDPAEPAATPALNVVVATVTFNAIAPGSSAIGFDGTNSVLVARDTTQNTLTATGISGTTITVTDNTAPTTPASISSPSQTVKTVVLNWAASTDNVGVTGYNIYRNDAKIGTSTTTTYTDSGLTPGTSYSYKLESYDAAGNISARSAATALSTKPDTTAPSMPGSLTMSARDMTSVTLGWTASTDDVAVTTYKIFRAGVLVGSTTSPTYKNTGLAPGTAYSFAVQAFDAAGNASSQAVLSATTVADTAAPTVPAGLVVQTQSATSAVIGWTASSDNVAVAGYNVYRAVGTGASVKLNTSTTTSYTDNGLAAGTYKYTVEAYDTSGLTSGKSTVLTVTIAGKAGDVNGDGKVNSTDISIIIFNYRKTGVTRAQGDISGSAGAGIADGKVDVYDISYICAQYGK